MFGQQPLKQLCEKDARILLFRLSRQTLSHRDRTDDSPAQVSLSQTPQLKGLFSLHRIPVHRCLAPLSKLLRQEAKHQIQHASDELYHPFTQTARSVPSGLSTEVRVELHVVGKRRFGIREVEEGVYKVFFGDYLVDHAGQGGLI